MARVPIPNGNLVARRPMNDVNFRAASSGGGAGAAFGAGLQQLGQMGERQADEQDRINAHMDEAAAKQQLVAYSGFRNQQLYSGDNPFSSLTGQAALNARAPVEKSLDDKIGELEKGLTSPRARGLFRQAVTAERQQDGVRIGTHAVQQARAYADQQDSALQGMAGQDFVGATLRGDTAAATAARGTLTNSLRAQYERNGLSGAPLEQALARTMSGMHASVVDGKMRADPVGASAYLHDHEAEMLPADRTKLADSLYAPLTERAASALADRAVAHVAGVALPSLATPPAGGSTLSRMIAITAFTESRGRDHDAAGQTITSPKGARGRMQVMPGTERDPGYGVRPAADGSDAERARVGVDYFGAMMKRYGNDPAKAWAAYNAGPGRLDKAIAAHGDAWLSKMPAETRNYVGNNLAMLGGSGGGASTFAPRRDDLNRAYQFIEQQDLPFDLKKAALAEVDKRVNRNDALLKRQQDDAKDQAFQAIDRLGDGFTSITQLPPAVRRSLSPEDAHRLILTAEHNARPKPVEPHGETITSLHQSVNLDPEGFKKTDLRLFRSQMTPAEYDQIATLQSSMLAKPDTPQQVSHSRIWQMINFHGRDIGVDMAAKRKGESDEAFKKRRTDGQALFSVMQNVINVVTDNGKRAATDDDIKKAFDNAVIQRRMPDGTVAPRYRDTTLATNSIAVPQAARAEIIADLRANGLPTDPQTIARVYIKGE